MPDENVLDAPETEAPAAEPESAVNPADQGNELLDSVALEGIDYALSEIPEEFRDGNKIRLNALIKSRQDNQTLAREKHPEAPEKYERNFSEQVQAVMSGEEDPIIMAIESSLKEKGGSQEQYDHLMETIGSVLPDILGSIPTAESRNAALEVLWGKNTPATLSATESYLEQKISDTETLEAMQTAMLDPKIARGLNILRNDAKGRAGVTGDGQPPTPQVSLDDQFMAVLESPEFVKGEASAQVLATKLREQLEDRDARAAQASLTG